jgi:hypothetical protein
MKWLILSPLPRIIMSIYGINCELMRRQLNLNYFCSLIPWLPDWMIIPLGHSQIRPSTRVYQLPRSPTDSLICSATPPYNLSLDNSLNHSHAHSLNQSVLFHTWSQATEKTVLRILERRENWVVIELKTKSFIIKPICIVSSYFETIVLNCNAFQGICKLL